MRCIKKYNILLAIMVQVDENVVNDWIYGIISKLDDLSAAREELLRLSTFILNAPREQSKGALPKIIIR